jgi:acetyltransferase-like isoleucine patch superfamily enzyme
MSSIHPTAFVHHTAAVEDDVALGEGSKVWAQTQVRRGARIGASCNVGRNVFVDVDVVVGDCCKIQNNASLFEGVTLDHGVFVGPHVIFTNDRVPRAVNADGSLKSADDWDHGRTVVRRGAALGAGTVVVTGVEIGEWSIIGSGAVVTRDVEPHALMVGNPARRIGWVSASGARCDTQDEARQRTVAEAAS